MNRSGRITLLLADISLYLSCMAMGVFLREGDLFLKVLQSPGHWFIVFVMVVLMYVFGAYDLSHSTTASKMMGRTLLGLFCGFILIVVVVYLGGKDRAGIFGRGILLGSTLVFGLSATLLRWGVITGLKKTLSRVRYLFIGGRHLYEQMQAEFLNNRFRSQSFFCVDEKYLNDPAEIVGQWGELEKVLESPFQMVVVSLDKKLPLGAMHSLLKSRFEANRVREISEFYEEVWQKIPLKFVEPRWFLLADGFELMGNPIRQRVKRLMDVVIALILLLLAAPLMILAWVLIQIESPGGAIYRQRRTGKGGAEFVIYKFRSMVENAEK